MFPDNYALRPLKGGKTRNVIFYSRKGLIETTNTFQINIWNVEDALKLMEENNLDPYAFRFDLENKNGSCAATSQLFFLSGKVIEKEKLNYKRDGKILNYMEIHSCNRIYVNTSHHFTKPMRHNDVMIDKDGKKYDY
jgi:hypothetical protein